ncbi:plasmid partitioning/stability family protein [Arsenophonus sp.]|uniref:plasmid partitioning/stability family protein n=1 Tax=Arsenophonus sp. TaxID=1872640 RepID=UPI00387992B2
MNEQRRKLWLYLYPDEQHQKEAIDIIESIPQRQRPDFFRDSLITGIAISTLDKRLPSLLALLLDKNSNISTLVRVLRLVIPQFYAYFKDDIDTPEVVAWQKRTIDPLQEGNPWSAWFAISQEEYDKLIYTPEIGVQVRALYAAKNGDNDIKGQKNIVKLSSNQSVKKNSSETFNNAKKMFGSKTSLNDS